MNSICSLKTALSIIFILVWVPFNSNAETYYPNGGSTMLYSDCLAMGQVITGCGPGNCGGTSLVGACGKWDPYFALDSAVCPSRKMVFFGAFVHSSTYNYNFPFYGWLCGPEPTKRELTVLAASPIIPTDSRVEQRKVLTKSALNLYITNATLPQPGILISLASNRPDLDTIIGPSISTDSSGKSMAEISTRAQPGQSTVTAPDTANITTIQPGTVSWLPAGYESEFLVTCYIIASESESARTPSSSGVCGLPPKETFRSRFLEDVKMQGSGIALNGAVIHYRGKGCYNIDACARTSSGVCAEVGTTIAVDSSVIPRRGTVNVAILGQRIAQDSGGGVISYHIDDYMGPAKKQCLSLGRRTSTIIFTNY